MESIEWNEGLERAYHLILGKLTRWGETGVKQLPNIAVALLILIGLWIVAKVARSLTRRGLGRTRLPSSLVALLAQVVYLLFVSVGTFIALSVLNLDKAVTSLLAGVGIVGLALSFAFQDIATNFISGLIMILQRPLKSGDLVKTNDFIGYVERVGLRSLVLRDLDGQRVLIPSKDVFQNAITNFSTESERRVNLAVGVSYGEDLERVEQITVEAVERLPFVLGSRAVSVHWNGFGGSSIDFMLRFWIGQSDQASYNAALAGALKAVKEAYDTHDIMIPFPIRTLDFGIKGGRTAEEVAAAISTSKESATTPRGDASGLG